MKAATTNRVGAEAPMSDEHLRSDATRALALTGTRGNRSPVASAAPPAGGRPVHRHAPACVGATVQPALAQDGQSLRLFHGTSLDPRSQSATPTSRSAILPNRCRRSVRSRLVPNSDANEPVRGPADCRCQRPGDMSLPWRRATASGGRSVLPATDALDPGLVALDAVRPVYGHAGTS